ncbi:MAG: hypothetical protein QGI21_06675 [Candidatus Poseidoniaceae archaeon]|jgi:CYTH domain-containing protein|nr:hypothetical protein [Candidatus Poseidoniaceae archaeon]
MGVEIERRFFVDGRNEKPWRGGRSISMIQHYLSDVTHNDGCINWNGKTLINTEGDLSSVKTWRIRKENDEYKLTGKGLRIGSVADEFQWDLSSGIYNSLVLDDLPLTQKTRHLWTGEDGLLWEIDEFEGFLSGLVIAEVELETANQEVIIPQWVGLELTHLKGWSNASLAKMVNDVLE